jgi:hypothetical protein
MRVSVDEKTLERMVRALARGCDHGTDTPCAYYGRRNSVSCLSTNVGTCAKRIREALDKQPLPDAPRFETLRSAVHSGVWQGLFLDGRNEHGSHVLTFPESNCDNFPIELLDDPGPDGVCEDILQDAERLGYQTGQAIITHWHIHQYHRDEGVGYEYTYDRIDLPLTELFYGTAEEQVAEARAVVAERSG